MRHFALLARLEPGTSLFVPPTFQWQQRTGKLPHMLRGMQGIVANNCPAELRKRQRYQLHGNPFLKRFKQYISLIQKVKLHPGNNNFAVLHASIVKFLEVIQAARDAVASLQYCCEGDAIHIGMLLT